MPRVIKIQNSTKPLPSIIQAKYCGDFWTKFLGLMFHPPIPTDGGVLLVEDRDGKVNATIHMFFMRFDICVVWINDAHEVVDVQLARRWRPAYAPAKPARYILETHVSQMDNFKIGDQVSFLYE